MKGLKKLIYEYRCGDLKVRNNITSSISMSVNFLIASAKIIMGILTISIFFVVSGFYSLGIGFSKHMYFKGIVYQNDKPKEAKYYLYMAVILLFSSLIYIGYMIRLFYIDATFVYTNILGISIATISFVDLGLAINGIVKSNKYHDLLLSGLKIINFSSALVALVLTQTALLSFASASASSSINRSNAIMGIIMGSISCFLAIVMIGRYLIDKRRQSETLPNETIN